MTNISRYPKSLNSQAIKYAQDHLNETEAKQIEYVQQLRTYFKENEPTLHQSRDDVILVAFLRVCKYDLERAIKKLRSYYKTREQWPEVFSERDPETAKLQRLLSLGAYVPLRKFHKNRLVILGRVSSFDIGEFRMVDILKLFYIMLDVSVKICPQVQIYGVCFLFDVEGYSLKHLLDLTPKTIKNVVNLWENYHCIPKQFEFVNVPNYFKIALNMLYVFMSTKLRQRIRIHDNGIASWLDVMDKSILPKEFGGDDGTLSDHIRFWQDEIPRHRHWLMYDS